MQGGRGQDCRVRFAPPAEAATRDRIRGHQSSPSPSMEPDMVNLFEALFYIAASVVKALHRKA